MKSAIVKRSIIINGHKTSVSLEDAFWSSLKNIAHTDGVPVSKWSRRLIGRANAATYPQQFASSYLNGSARSLSPSDTNKGPPRW